MSNQANPPNVTPALSETQQFARVPSKLDHPVETYQTLLEIYIKKRVEGQQAFYENRYKEFDTNSAFMVAVSAAIMAASTILSALGVYTQTALMAFGTAILPAFATLVAALRQLYQWEKQSALYKDASLGLQEALLIMPDRDTFDPRTANVITPHLIKTAEEVFTSEINQWGQIALGLEDQQSEDALNQRLRDLEVEDRVALAIGGQIPPNAPPTPFVSATPTVTFPPIPDPEDNEDGAVG